WPRISILVPSSLRQTKRHGPPGRRSISQTGIVQPSGPSSQFGTCSEFVQASQTSSRGASKARVISSSRSDTVVRVVSPTFVVDILPLLSLELLQVLVEPFVALIPEAPVVLCPLGHLF